MSMNNAFLALQKLGRSLMLPISVLPVASLLLRLGQPDLLDLPYVTAAGNAVFANLGLLFAIGIAVGLSKDNNGAAGLAAAVAYFVTTEGAKVLLDAPADVSAGAVGRAADLLLADYRDTAIQKLSVPAGLLTGITAGRLYNRYAEIRLPDYLAFFAGRRFVPIVSGFVALFYAAGFGYGAPVLEGGINGLSALVVGAGELGLFAFGVLNRILIITGLHHVLNNLAWFLVGDFEGVTGDLRRFFAGDPAAGAFMSGFFPVMMFGLPAACLAMYRSAASKRRKAVAGLLFSMALTSFLTGITEPVEFTFIFLAPVLFVIHAVLTGLSMVIMDFLGVRLGFGFSAGLFDYVINFKLATRPLLMPVVGAVYFAVYYAVFRFFIVRFDLQTPGRGEPIAALAQSPQSSQRDGEEFENFVTALGGRSNLVAIDACMTRLRLQVGDSAAIDEDMLQRLGAIGVMRPTDRTVQVVVGLRAEAIATGMRAITQHVERRAAGDAAESPPASAASSGTCDAPDGEALLAALGSATNVASVDAFGTRLCVKVYDRALIDEAAVLDSGCRGIADSGDDRIQLVLHDSAHALQLQLDGSS